jgi:hypothetical protein
MQTLSCVVVLHRRFEIIGHVMHEIGDRRMRPFADRAANVLRMFQRLASGILVRRQFGKEVVAKIDHAIEGRKLDLDLVQCALQKGLGSLAADGKVGKIEDPRPIQHRTTKPIAHVRLGAIRGMRSVLWCRQVVIPAMRIRERSTIVVGAFNGPRAIRAMTGPPGAAPFSFRLVRRRSMRRWFVAAAQAPEIQLAVNFRE